MGSESPTLTVFQGYLFGYPADWIIWPVIGIMVFMFIIVGVIFLRRGEEEAIEEDLALVVPEDEHGTLQTGQLIGNVERTEDMLLVTIPSWKDEDGNEYSAELDITKKVAFPFFDINKALKRLWIILDQGDLTVVSFTTLLHGLPKRWDPPYADRRKAGKFLVGRYGSQSLTNLLASKMGVLVIFGIILSGMGLCFFLVTVSGHLR